MVQSGPGRRARIDGQREHLSGDPTDAKSGVSLSNGARYRVITSSIPPVLPWNSLAPYQRASRIRRDRKKRADDTSRESPLTTFSVLESRIATRAFDTIIDESAVTSGV